MKTSKQKVLQSIAAVLAAALVFFFILTASIGLPIYIRPFYYWHIDAMALDAASGYTAQQIRDGYDDVLDYLTLPGREFAAGDFTYSDEGASHFADCKVLFDLNAWVLVLSSLGLLALGILRWRKKLQPLRLGKRSAAFWGALTAVVLPVVLGGLAALDFDRAFVIFHSLFFPGKDNWIFDYDTDPIIRVLPQDFFMHCAILIALGVIVFSCAVFIWEACRSRRERKKKRK